MDTETAWRERPVILAGLGMVAALAVQHLLRGYAPDAGAVALASGIAVAAVALGFALERVRIAWAVIFASALGIVVGLVLYWNGDPASHGDWADWRTASLFLAVAIAVPLFQVARDAGAWRFPYAEVHGHAWTNVVLWFACWLFAGIAFALAWLLASLFGLIGLTFLRDLLRHDWANAALFGAAFGGAIGLLREGDRIVRLLQRVVTTVLGVLAPVLAAGLVLFLCALPFTGLGALWEATRQTTPILLTCVIGALILANAVIGNGAGDEAANPLLRYGALALAVAMLPLTAIAALATGLRIQQYGYSPDRLWALVFVILASVYATAYLGSVVRGRLGWAAFAREANLRLAFVVAGVALVLATPLLSFNAISTRDQVARLTSGRVSPDKFDWAALAFDFGMPGKAALRRLAGSTNVQVARLAKAAAARRNRYDVADTLPDDAALNGLTRRLRVLPTAVSVPEALRIALLDYRRCGRDAERRCTLLYHAGATEAVLVQDNCIANVATEPGTGSSAPTVFIVDQDSDTSICSAIRYRLVAGQWTPATRGAPDAGTRAALRDGLAAGRIDIRTVPRRQVFVGGVAVGDPFE